MKHHFNGLYEGAGMGLMEGLKPVTVQVGNKRPDGWMEIKISSKTRIIGSLLMWPENVREMAEEFVMGQIAGQKGGDDWLAETEDGEDIPH
jgi:hypothetical protein